MTAQVQELLYSFNHLSETEQREFAIEILKRTARFDFPPLEDNDLVYHAEELFLALDQEEAING